LEINFIFIKESERQVGPSKEAASEFIRNIVKGANKQVLYYLKLYVIQG